LPWKKCGFHHFSKPFDLLGVTPPYTTMLAFPAGCVAFVYSKWIIKTGALIFSMEM
jgi:hypothetical protein